MADFSSLIPLVNESDYPGQIASLINTLENYANEIENAIGIYDPLDNTQLDTRFDLIETDIDTIMLIDIPAINSDITTINSDITALESTARVNVQWYGAVGDGITDDTAAIQAALNASLEVYLPTWFRITAPLTVRNGQKIIGVSALESGLIKTDFNGAAIVGVDTDWVVLEDFGIDGPGQWIGTGNKGIDIHVSAQEILTNLTIKRVHLRYLNDIGLYVGTGAFCHYENVKVWQCGFAGIFIDGGDAHTLTSCSVRDIILGIWINGATTVGIGASYVEQAGLGIWLNGANSVCILESGVEANINRGVDYPGRSYRISGGEGNSIISALSRQDTIGAAAADTAQHLLIDTNASRVTVTSFRKVNHATYIPTTEVDVSGANEPVYFGPNNFDAARTVGGINFGEIAILNGGILDDAHLPATISSDITGTAANSLLLGGQDGDFYRDAANINTGTLSDARLPASISSDITGTAENANNLGNYPPSSYRDAGNLTTGTLSYNRLGTTNGNRDWVLARIAAANVNAVGTYGTLRYVLNWPGQCLPGHTSLGSNLEFSHSNQGGQLLGGTYPGGTWMLMGYLQDSPNSSTWLRIS